MIRPPAPIFPAGTPVAVVTDLGGPRAANPGFSAPEQIMGLPPPARPPHHHPFFASGGAAPPAPARASATGGAPPIPSVYTGEVVNYLLNALRGADEIPEAQLWQRRRAALPLITAAMLSVKFSRQGLEEIDKQLWTLVADPKSRDAGNALHFDLLMAYMTLAARSLKYDREFAERLVSDLGARHETVSEARPGAYPFSRLVWVHAHMGLDPKRGAPASDADKPVPILLGWAEQYLATSKDDEERYSILRDLRLKLSSCAINVPLNYVLSCARAFAILLADGHPQVRDEAMKAYVDLRERIGMTDINPEFILLSENDGVITRPLAERVRFASGADGKGVDLTEIAKMARTAARNFMHPEKSEEARLPRARTLAGPGSIRAADVMEYARRKGRVVKTTAAVAVVPAARQTPAPAAVSSAPAVEPKPAPNHRAALAEKPDESGDPRLGRTR